MDEPRRDSDADDPRRSIAAFVEAARREGLLSDVEATAFVAFHTRLVSVPSIEKPTETELRAVDRLMRDLDATRRQIAGASPDRPLLSGASQAIHDSLRSQNRAVLVRATAEARRVLDAASQRLRQAEARRVAEERATAAMPPEAERNAAHTLIKQLAGRRQTVLESQRPAMTTAMEQLSRLIDEGPAEALHSAMDAARHLLRQTRRPEPVATAGPTDKKAIDTNPTRRAAQDLLLRLKGRYQRAGRKDRDTIGVAIHSLSRALDGTSDDDLATAMTRSMSALGIQPAPVPSMQRPSSPPPSETRPAPSMPTRTVAPEPKRKAQAEPIEPPRQRPQVATEPPARRTRPVRPVRTGPSRFDRWAKNLKKSSSQA